MGLRRTVERRYRRGMAIADNAPDFDTLAAAGRAGPATRADLEPLATKADLAALETRLTVRFFGALLAVAALIIAAIEYL